MKTLLYNSLSSLRISLYCQQSLMPSFPSGCMWWELTVDVRIKKISYGQQFQILSFLQVFGASWQFQLSVLHWREEMLIKNEPPLINCLFLSFNKLTPGSFRFYLFLQVFSVGCQLMPVLHWRGGMKHDINPDRPTWPWTSLMISYYRSNMNCANHSDCKLKSNDCLTVAL